MGDQSSQPARNALPSRLLPARELPVPTTVSPALQRRIANHYPIGWDKVPNTADEWRALAAESVKAVAFDISVVANRFKLKIERAEVAGVPVFVIIPPDIPPENEDRLLLHLHGGGYVLYPGEAGAGEAMLMAGFGGFRVVSVDYRMPPDFPFPAALDDAAIVWAELAARNDPRRMGIFGSSAGGGLLFALLLRAKAEGLPLPAAIAAGTPWVDLTGADDSVQANAYVDNMLVARTGWLGAAAELYAAGHDLSNPLISPIYGDFTGLPPAILTSGTRDLFLSSTVRAHRKLRQAGIDAVLQVFEAQSHAQFLELVTPECAEAFAEITAFLGSRLDQ
jgi:epsilon-lactone hydrolase